MGRVWVGFGYGLSRVWVRSGRVWVGFDWGLSRVWLGLGRDWVGIGLRLGLDREDWVGIGSTNSIRIQL